MKVPGPGPCEVVILNFLAFDTEGAETKKVEICISADSFTPEQALLAVDQLLVQFRQRMAPNKVQISYRGAGPELP